MDRRFHTRLLATAAAALLLRIVARLLSGEADFWQNGYTFLFELARNVAAGNGYAFDNQPPTMARVPVYPLFLAAVTSGRQAFLALVIAHSLVGAATVVCVGLLTAELFGRSGAGTASGAAGTNAALIAAAIAGIYPYYVVHDTALQDTALFTLLSLISVLLLRRARRSMSGRIAAAAGLVLAAAVLTRSTIAPFAVVAPLWLYAARSRGSQSSRETSLTERARAALLCAATLVLGVAPWLVRSYVIAGTPVLESDTGARLWDGNSPFTFSRYPEESIDLSKAAAIEALTANELAELGAAGSDEVAVDPWFLHHALAFMRAHPWLTIANGLRKIGAAFSILPSPRRSFWPTLAYSLSYGPVMVLGLFGMIASWRSWREHSLIYWLFGSFALLTAVVFGHTSHRVFLDVYWMAFAAAAIIRSESVRRAQGRVAIA